MSMRFTLLGTGSSGGVPRIGPVWGACDPTNPKNRRRRCALLIDRYSRGSRTRVLVDTPTDLREQLLDAGVETLDAVLFTHDHADHTHGIDDLRGVFFNMRRRVPVWAEPSTLEGLESRFGYCFAQQPGSIYPSILQAHAIHPPQPIDVEGAGGLIEAIPIMQEHGSGPSLGFRFGNVAYSPDISGVPEDLLTVVERARFVDCRCAEANTSPQPFFRKAGPGMDRAFEGQARDPHTYDRGAGLRHSAQAAAASCRTGLRRHGRTG